MWLWMVGTIRWKERLIGERIVIHYHPLKELASNWKPLISPHYHPTGKKIIQLELPVEDNLFHQGCRRESWQGCVFAPSHTTSCTTSYITYCTTFCIPPPIPPHTTLSYHPHTTQPCPPRWYEKEQTRVGIQSVKSWAAEGNIDVDDLFISGNADEVLLMLSLYHHSIFL